MLVFSNLRQNINLQGKKSWKLRHIVLLVHSKITIGTEAAQFARERDARRVYRAGFQSTSDSKEARSARKKAKSEEAEEHERTEGILYGAGIAD